MADGLARGKRPCLELRYDSGWLGSLEAESLRLCTATPKCAKLER
jgi:hypothetical protein